MNKSIFTFFFLALASSAKAQTATTKPQLPPVVTWQWGLDKAAKQTSAGVYDEKGKLVRVLWTMKPMTQGDHLAGWDGKNNDGEDVPAGKYTYKVVANRSTYQNIGIVGNTGENTFQHVPNNFENVAVDNSGNIFTVHDWDEAHHDVKMWDAKTGRVISHSGHPIGGLVKSIAVEPDGSYVYVGWYENLWNRQESKFLISKLKVDKTPGTSEWKREAFTKAGNELVLYNGNNSAAFAPNATEAEKMLRYFPMFSMVVRGGDLVTTDTLNDKILIYDKNSGEQKQSFPVKLPRAIALAPDGKIWIAHEQTKISVFDVEGKQLATPLNDLQNVVALAVRGNTLYAADGGAGQIKIYDIAGNDLTLRRTFGEKARPGDRASHRFYHLLGLAVDKDGGIITAQNEYFFNGGRLAKFDASGKPMWENLGLEFQAVGTYSATNPDVLVSVMHHAYAFNRKTGEGKYLGNTFTGEKYRAEYNTIRAIRLGKQELVFMSNGDGMIVYRLEPALDKFRGPTLKMISIVGGAMPNPYGVISQERWKDENKYLWSWHDEKGDGQIDEGEQSIFQKPEQKAPLWQYGPMSADAEGNLWFASYGWDGRTRANNVWVLPMTGWDKQNNPIYDWKTARRVTAQEQVKVSGGGEGLAGLVQPKFVQMADDGSFYVYGQTGKPGTPQNGGLHMGGNSLIRFTLKKGAKVNSPQPPPAPGAPPVGAADYPETPTLADLQWMVLMPEMSVGLAPIPAGKKPEQSGVMVGGRPFRGGIYHYTKDGLLIGEFQSDEARFGGQSDKWKNWPTGLIDVMGGVNVNRDPRDGIIDVFVEDNFNLRILWYRVDDRDIQTLTGEIARP